MPLTPDEISELLSQPLLGHIAVVKGGRPHVTPIWVYTIVASFTSRPGFPE